MWGKRSGYARWAVLVTLLLCGLAALGLLVSWTVMLIVAGGLVLIGLALFAVRHAGGRVERMLDEELDHR